MSVNETELGLVDYGTPALPLGAAGYLAVVVQPDGRSDFWVIVPGAGEASVTFPEHELLGPLPAHVAARVRMIRCGAPCRDGHACRAPVAPAGARCWHHTSGRRTPS